MGNILWLDDQPTQIARGVQALKAAGHAVRTVGTEAEVTQLLAEGPLPDLVIQDLEREGILAGWEFYERTLKPRYPGVPVIICSYDAYFEEHRRLADDFNLAVLDKTDDDVINIVGVVRTVLSTQRVSLTRHLEVPAVIAIDFEKVNTALISHLARNPSSVHELSWITFERLVKTLLRELGYDVLHTPLTRDGGVDIWALRSTALGETLYAIDTKKYAPTRLVGPEPVRAIYGVASMAGATAGLIVTTSRFGPAAREIAGQYRYRVGLRDFDGLTEWIRQVERGGAD